MNKYDVPCKEITKRSLSGRLSSKISVAKRTKLPDSINVDAHSAESNNSCIHSFYDSKKNSVYTESKRLNQSFFLKPCVVLAQNLLGKILCRKLPTGEILKGVIVETESYLGVEDKASHSYNGKRTNRNEAMFLKPGTAYVYSIYGMYYCFNISSFEEGSAVLIRALEPLEGLETMRIHRSVKRKNSGLKDKELCNGPSKLCQALVIEKHSLNKVDLCTSLDLWLEYGSEIPHCNIISCRRIGIDSYGAEWANKPLRFYTRDCNFVSIRNKEAEIVQNQ